MALKGDMIRTAENSVCFYLKKFASQTLQYVWSRYAYAQDLDLAVFRALINPKSTVVSHFVAKQLEKSILKLKFYS